MFEKVSQSLKYDSKFCLVHKHITPLQKCCLCAAHIFATFLHVLNIHAAYVLHTRHIHFACVLHTE